MKTSAGCGSGEADGGRRLDRDGVLHLAFQSERRMARDLFAPASFVEVYVNTPIESPSNATSKGFTRSARGLIPNFTGIDSPTKRPRPPTGARYRDAYAEKLAQVVVDYALK